MGPIAAKVAAASGDQLIHVRSDPVVATTAIAAFKAAGGMGKPCMGEISFCYHESEATAKGIAYQWWPIVANKGDLNWLLPSWNHYGQLQQMVTPDRVAGIITCGPGPSGSSRRSGGWRSPGSTGSWWIVVHRAGPEQDRFLRFAREELLPALR